MSKKKQGTPRFAYQKADMRTFEVKFTNSELGNILLLLDATKEHLEMELDIDGFLNSAIQFYFDTLNRAVHQNIRVKQEAAAAAAKEAEGDESGTEDTAGTSEQSSEAVDTGALADENEGDSKTTGTEG